MCEETVIWGTGMPADRWPHVQYIIGRSQDRARVNGYTTRIESMLH